ncbi:peptidoglycan-binding domain-containing protein [Inquilinus sp. OTU3971]|uniref:peptidoglycan-binding domain-containing protein n=1 Tax=Inquilinus sp. OTU3971 TaxID=3043855 RepID=UPI00313E78A4
MATTGERSTAPEGRAPGSPPPTAARPAPQQQVAAVPAAPAAPAEPAAPASQPAGDAQLREIQQLLTMMNYNAGPVDGRLSRQTRNAIAAFQRQQKLRVTSRPSPALLEALRQAAGAETPDWTPGHF